MWIARTARRRRWARLVVPERGTHGRRRSLSWHGAVGIVAALGLLALSATGLTWSSHAGANITKLRAGLGWQTMSVDTALTGAPSTAGEAVGRHRHGGRGSAPAPSDGVLGTGIGLNGVHATALGQGLRDPMVLTPPAAADQAWTASENKDRWPTRADSVAIDAANGQVVDRVDFADQSLPAKLARWGTMIHMGVLFGAVNQIVLAALALCLITLLVLGYRMWWQRRPTRDRSRRPGPLLPPGGLRRAPVWLDVVLLGLAAAIGWFLPLFGIPLLAFLAIDVLLAARSRRAPRGEWSALVVPGRRTAVHRALPHCRGTGASTDPVLSSRL